MGVRVGAETVQGERIDIEVEKSGQFSADWDGHTFREDTKAKLLEALKKAIKASSKRPPVEVTILDWRFESNFNDDDRGYVAHVQLRGQNVRTHQYLLTCTGEDGEPEKRTIYANEFTERVVRRLTDEEVAEYSVLVDKVKQAEAAVQAFREARAFDAEAWIRGELQAAEEAAEA